MPARFGRCNRSTLFAVWALTLALLAPAAAFAVPFAALVMDARNGQIVYQDNANTRLHPASLTKMMTLYITFSALRAGDVTLDTPVKVTAHAAGQPPSKLGLRAGQVIALRYLIRAAAVKSANDAAAAIGDFLGGNEAGFAAKMNETAKLLGMTESTFKNANGLTRPGHLSSARDMAIIARHLVYDFPEYYNNFSRTETDAGMATVYSTNRAFLDSYPGADGIKTGFTWASGFNLAASAVHGNKRLIGVVFGGTSTAERNKKMEQLLNMGFARVAENVPLRKPAIPNMVAVLRGIPAGGPAPAPVLVAQNGDAGGGAQVASSIRPAPRPEGSSSPTQVAVAAAAAAVDPASTVAPADPEIPAVVPPPRPSYATPAEAVAENDGEAVDPGTVKLAATAKVENVAASAKVENVEPTSAAGAAPAPAKPRPEIVFASVAPAPRPTADDAPPEVISRLSTSGGRDWAITLGRFGSRDAADRALLRTALAEPTVLNESLRKVVNRPNGFDANFVGLTQKQADLACARLQARSMPCFELAP